MSVQSRWLVAVAALVVVFVGAQAVPYGRQRVNPPIGTEPPWDSADTRALAKLACFDCHSNETRWPAYARIAPVSWLIHHDVDEGRAVLNFSEWQRPQQEAGEAAEEIREAEMPPAVYRLMHAEARLSDAELERLARGLASTLGSTRESVKR
jgi:hypothetical protein